VNLDAKEQSLIRKFALFIERVAPTEQIIEWELVDPNGYIAPAIAQALTIAILRQLAVCDVAVFVDFLGCMVLKRNH
jgi:hypothetical protein